MWSVETGNECYDKEVRGGQRGDREGGMETGNEWYNTHGGRCGVGETG
jgi:hypothetical protein